MFDKTFKKAILPFAVLLLLSSCGSSSSLISSNGSSSSSSSSSSFSSGSSSSNGSSSSSSSIKQTAELIFSASSPNGSEVTGQAPSISLSKGEKSKLPNGFYSTFRNEGYYCSGWKRNTADNANLIDLGYEEGYVELDVATVDSLISSARGNSIVLYADWTKETYQVSFEYSPYSLVAGVSIDDGLLAYGDALPSQEKFDEYGNVLVGWSTKENDVYGAYSSMEDAGDMAKGSPISVTLHAVFTPLIFSNISLGITSDEAMVVNMALGMDSFYTSYDCRTKLTSTSLISEGFSGITYETKFSSVLYSYDDGSGVKQYEVASFDKKADSWQFKSSTLLSDKDKRFTGFLSSPYLTEGYLYFTYE